MPSRNILIVEDDGEARLDIEAALDRAGFTVAGAACSGEKAIELADSLNPDMILMDMQLDGEMDGLEAAHEISRRFDIPIVYLTFAIDNETLQRVQVSGPYGYLLKPVDHTELRAAIEVGLYRHQMEHALRKANRAAEAASRAKTSFLATVSHELRTPMNGVLGMTELLLMSDLEDPYRENVQLIKDSSMALLSVLNQIIDYSKLETSSLKMRAIDFRLEDMVSGLLSRHQRVSRSKGVNLKYSIDSAVPGWLRGDSTKLRQVLSNLISNAVKFTSSGQVLVDVSPASNGDIRRVISNEDEMAVQILVQDNGIGIHPDKLEEIFESFEQGEDYLFHSSGGLGLGLAIVNRLTSFLGGTVRCSSVEGRGSIFSIIIPLKRSRYELAAPSEMALGVDSRIKGAKILVAEDDLVNQRYIVRLLGKMGCEVALAKDGQQAVDKLKEQRFDIVFMDVEMPNLNGIEATKRIRRLDTRCLDPKVPIIALTAHAMWGDEQRCMHAGMDDYVSKPVDIDTIAAIIQSTLEKG